MMQDHNRQYPRAGIHGRVVHELGRDIVTGCYQPGEKLPDEAEFLKKFNGSRTAIREAFRVLTAKGLLVARQRAGTKVRAKCYWNLLDPDIISWQVGGENELSPIYQMMELRGCFQPGISRLAAERASLDQIDMLDGLQRKMVLAEEAGNGQMFYDAVSRFHGCLFDGCQNDFANRLKDVAEAVLISLYRGDGVTSRIIVGMSSWYRLAVEKIQLRDGAATEKVFQNLIEHERKLLNRKVRSAELLENAVA